MKKLVLIILSVLAVSCNNDTAPKPEHLLKEDEMVNIFYDISLLQAIKSFTPKSLAENDVDVKHYIYKKYNIDSLTFAQNHAYYASDLEQYQKMQREVVDRLNADKEKIEPKKTKPGSKKDSVNPGPKTSQLDSQGTPSN